MFDKIIIVLATSSLLRNSQSTAEAYRFASPLVLFLRTFFAPDSPLPTQIRKNGGSNEGGKVHSVHSHPFPTLGLTQATLLRSKEAIGPEGAYISGTQ